MTDVVAHRRVHMALSVDVDRFTDSYLEKHYDGVIRRDGEPVPWWKLRSLCAEYRAMGYEAFPPCDNTDTRGNCRGHEDAPPCP